MPASPVLAALKHVWQKLESLNLPTAVMGGIALAAWQHVRATRDIDILISLESTNLDAVLKLLATARVEPKRRPPVLTLGSLRIVQLQCEAPGTFVDIQIDLLLADNVYQAEALSRRVAIRLPDLDFEVFVLSCEDLLIHKLLAGRIIDRADAAALLRLNSASLDFGYLRQWTRSLNLESDLTDVWTEALPGQQMPQS
ncbi:MAG TPA: nucleotidyl transferase AbiEii/AbiGii toxin family protein [Gemmataceae bacterium]|nr:nucleotidyl transferase AbiEii/AbiGii toxin family protein [Gemmataceae bacterium]